MTTLGLVNVSRQLNTQILTMSDRNLSNGLRIVAMFVLYIDSYSIMKRGTLSISGFVFVQVLSYCLLI